MDAAGMQTFSYWMQGMHCGFCGLHSFFPILFYHAMYLLVGGPKCMTSGTGCKGCQKDESLHPQL